MSTPRAAERAFGFSGGGRGGSWRAGGGIAPGARRGRAASRSRGKARENRIVIITGQHRAYLRRGDGRGGGGEGACEGADAHLGHAALVRLDARLALELEVVQHREGDGPKGGAARE